MTSSKLRKAFDKKPKRWQVHPKLLLLQRVPKPMHGVAPRIIMGDVWWNKTRQSAYRSTAFHCQACGAYKFDARYRQWLEGHEVYEINRKAGRMTYTETVPLCHLCHLYIHRGRLDALAEKGQITHAKYIAAIQHGDRVLAQAKLSKPGVYKGPTAKWADWRLVFNGKEYPPKYKTEEDWRIVYEK